MTNSDQPAEEEAKCIQAEQDEHVALKTLLKLYLQRDERMHTSRWVFMFHAAGVLLGLQSLELLHFSFSNIMWP